MTTTTSNADHPATITQNDMNTLIAQGRAHPWTDDLRSEMPQAALLDGAWNADKLDAATPLQGTWYVVPVNADTYQQAAPELAEILTRDLARLRAADHTVADIDTRNST